MNMNGTPCSTKLNLIYLLIDLPFPKYFHSSLKSLIGNFSSIIWIIWNFPLFNFLKEVIEINHNKDIKIPEIAIIKCQYSKFRLVKNPVNASRTELRVR